VNVVLVNLGNHKNRAGFSWWGPWSLGPPPFKSGPGEWPESHRVNYAFQYFTGTTNEFSFQYRSTGIAKLNNG